MNYDTDMLEKASRVWLNIVTRCYNSNNVGYHNYGGRGIGIDKSWLENPTAFINWYIKNYQQGYQVDRIDVNGQYSEENCRIISQRDNANNKRNTIFLTAFGETKCLSDWILDERCLAKRPAIQQRIKNGWNHEEALTLGNRESVAVRQNSTLSKNRPELQSVGHHPNDPIYEAFGESKSLAGWYKDKRCSIAKQALLDRIERGWEIEKAISTPAAANSGNLYEGKTVLQWSKDPKCIPSYNTLNKRLKDGWGLETALTTGTRKNKQPVI